MNKVFSYDAYVEALRSSEIECAKLKAAISAEQLRVQSAIEAHVAPDSFAPRFPQRGIKADIENIFPGIKRERWYIDHAV